MCHCQHKETSQAEDMCADSLIGNTDTAGLAVSGTSASLTGCQFVQNTALGDSGVINIGAHSRVLLRNNSFAPTAGNMAWAADGSSILYSDDTSAIKHGPGTIGQLRSASRASLGSFASASDQELQTIQQAWPIDA
jgi:hypothetical protein